MSSLDKESLESGDGVKESGENDEDDDESSTYDPQRVTVPLTLCVAIMVG